jgi:hypothetical protein
MMRCEVAGTVGMKEVGSGEIKDTSKVVVALGA